MTPKNKKSALGMLDSSIQFNILVKRLEVFGLHWKKDKRYFEVDMPETGVEWRSYIKRKFWIFVPIEKLPKIKHLHYSFPYPFGIWSHRTITWEDGKRKQYKFKSAAGLLANKYDVAEDYIAFREKLLKSFEK
jgi:hypothetical protein